MNVSKEAKTLRDFVEENPELIEMFRDQYDHKAEDGFRLARRSARTRQCARGRLGSSATRTRNALTAARPPKGLGA